MGRAHLELPVDVELVDVVDHVDDLDAVELVHDGEGLREARGVVDDHVEVAHDVVGADPDGADVADVRAGRADRGGEATEHAGPVVVAAAERAEQRIGHGPRGASMRITTEGDAAGSPASRARDGA